MLRELGLGAAAYGLAACGAGSGTRTTSRASTSTATSGWQGCSRASSANVRHRRGAGRARPVGVGGRHAAGVHARGELLDRLLAGTGVPRHQGLNRLAHRYLTEDVGYGLALLTDVAGRLGVPTPVADAVIELASVVLGREFKAERARTLETLGLADCSAEQLAAL